MIRMHVIQAVTKRNFGSYFSSILGYLFIIVFCVSSAVMAFNSQFFTANQANLDQLTQSFPLLLLFIVPAITMTAWSDEKKLGTDELLFTLPATELEILIGKFKAVVGVYTVALAFSLFNVVILSLVGSPDYWMLFSTYFGYWLAGVALLSVGLLASSLTSSATVAFVLGVVFCCVPVFISNLAGGLQWALTSLSDMEVSQLYSFQSAMQELSLEGQLQDFGIGVTPFTSVMYFVLLTALMLYLNHVVICKRRWVANNQANMAFQYVIRTVSLLVIFVSVFTLISLWPVRVDFTSEKLFTLSEATNATFDNLDEKNITIQAFVSPEVPREYSETRRNLLGMLREFDQRGGRNITVRLVDVEPFSEEAEEARALGVNPQRIQYEQDGKFEESEVFLGAVVQSTTDTVEIPFFGKGLPVEYELTRSVRTVALEERLTIGVLQTDARVIGSGGMSPGREWAIVRELRQQYKVIAVNPSNKILAGDKEGSEEKFDLLLAVMPSSLTEPQMDNFLEYVEAGRPALIFDDPCPFFALEPSGFTMAPKLPKPSAGGGMMGQQAPPEKKADNGELTSLMTTLGLEWNNAQVVYDRMKPFPQFESLPPEYLFVSRTGNPKEAFNSDDPVTEDLANVVLLYSGFIKSGSKDGVNFSPLLQTSAQSGLLDWEDYTQPSFNFMSRSQSVVLKPNPERFDNRFSHVIAGHVTSDSETTPLNVIFCSDIDMISDWFFSERLRGNLDVKFDNVTFILNAVDALAGNDQFIKLRSRRSKLRTLEFVEAQTRQLRETLNKEEKAADKHMGEMLAEAKKELKEVVERVRQRDDLDVRSQEQLVLQAEEQENRQLAYQQNELEQEKNKRIRKAGLAMIRQVRKIEDGVKFKAYLAPAILPICFGLLFLGLRNLYEAQNINPERRRR
ncbi:MAG: Gldg family protein [Fuerstiella sp.]